MALRARRALHAGRGMPSLIVQFIFSLSRNIMSVFITLRITLQTLHITLLLGVNIAKKLNFDSHVSYLCKNTSRQVNALSRLRHIANENSKNVLYKTYIMSNFNYCSAIWNYCSSKSIIKLEKLNKRALRIVLNDDKCTYHDLLRISQNICLFSMRRECIMKTVFLNVLIISHLHTCI